ncbi:MAG: MoaD/ThiS family protein [Anaerolineae bacterium]|nr:MoaD/ThiS family protein [Anaerolineae bacterium]
MSVHVRLFGILRDKLPASQKGKAEVELPNGASVADLLAHLDITRRVEVAVNDQLEIENTHILNNGDQVHLFTLIGGG